MVVNNKNLRSARGAKNDEFYTCLSDIEKELRHYKHYFKNKIVLCNCDDPYESNFFKYFASNFNKLKLKKLITTCYSGSSVTGTQLSLFDVVDIDKEGVSNKKPYKVEITEVKDENNDGAIDLADVEFLIKNKKNVLTLLEGDGDFRSQECINLLKEADIVVTNPPFSIAREFFIPLLIENKKKFIVIGDLNWITYKNIFPLLKDDVMWLGYNTVKEFLTPDNGVKKFGNKLWYTNVDIKKRHEKIDLIEHYSPEKYVHYENFNAINIDKVLEIPVDYNGVMGVPITFLNYYNPEQFEIIGFGSGYLGQSIGITGIPKEHKVLMKGHSAAGDLYMMINGMPKVPYGRILIKKR